MPNKSEVREIAYALTELAFERAGGTSGEANYDPELLDVMTRASDMLLSILVHGIEEGNE